MEDDPYREQHKLRLAYMPWLYDSLKPKQRQWGNRTGGFGRLRPTS